MYISILVTFSTNLTLKLTLKFNVAARISPRMRLTRLILYVPKGPRFFGIGGGRSIMFRRRRLSCLAPVCLLFWLCVLTPLFYQYQITITPREDEENIYFPVKYYPHHESPGGKTAYRPPVTMVTTQAAITRQKQNSTGSAKMHPISTERPPLPLLTLFTTFRHEPKKFHLYQNTIRNWAAFKKRGVKLVLFSTYKFRSRDVLETALREGWDVRPSPRVNANGTPYLKELFLTLLDQYQSTFYGFASGDMLFTEGFISTLEFLKNNLPDVNKTLITGRRLNYVVNDTEPVFTPSGVEQLWRKRNMTVYRSDAEDYLIMSRGYPWQRVPNLHIGRPGADNFVVAFAYKENLTIVDSTNTVVAVHQSLPRNASEPPDRPNLKEGPYNQLQIGNITDIRMGSTLVAQCETQRDGLGNFYLVPRMSASRTNRHRSTGGSVPGKRSHM